jgi:hypothetical protein
MHVCRREPAGACIGLFNEARGGCVPNQVAVADEQGWLPTHWKFLNAVSFLAPCLLCISCPMSTRAMMGAQLVHHTWLVAPSSGSCSSPRARRLPSPPAGRRCSPAACVFPRHTRRCADAVGGAAPRCTPDGRGRDHSFCCGRPGPWRPSPCLRSCWGLRGVCRPWMARTGLHVDFGVWTAMRAISMHSSPFRPSVCSVCRSQDGEWL